jgi:hypothetical protein
VTSRNRAPARPLLNSCDRCGKWCHAQFLYFDAIGWICGSCRMGADGVDK